MPVVSMEVLWTMGSTMSVQISWNLILHSQTVKYWHKVVGTQLIILAKIRLLKTERDCFTNIQRDQPQFIFTEFRVEPI